MRRLVRIYPAAWRQRYGDEFEVLLDDLHLGWRDVLDLLVGAVDAHLSVSLFWSGQNERIGLMLFRLRRTVLVIFCAYIAFVIAGIGFQKMTEYEDFTEVAQAHTSVAIAFDIVFAGSIVALLAIAIGAAPIALELVREWRSTGRRDLLIFMAVPPLAALVFLASTVGVTSFVDWGGGRNGLEIAAVVAWIMLFFVCAVASTAAVCTAVLRSDVPERSLRFASRAGIVATLAMGAMLIATVVWGLLLRTHAPVLYNGHEGIMDTSTKLTWLGVTGAMALSTAIAAIAAKRGAVGPASEETYASA